MGGSFNPAHAAAIAPWSLYAPQAGLGLNQNLRELVSPQNPLKPEKGMAPFVTRLQQASELARHPGIFATGIEAEFGTRYTVDTLCGAARLLSGPRNFDVA